MEAGSALVQCHGMEQQYIKDRKFEKGSNGNTEEVSHIDIFTER